VIRCSHVRTGAVIAFILALPIAARANPDSLVPSAIPPQPGEPTNLVMTLTYDYEADHAQIEREQVGPGVPANGPIPLQKDLEWKQNSHTITPRVDIGILRDAWIYGALPIVIAQSRDLRLDSGVSYGTSSTVASKLVPTGGYAASDPTTPPGGSEVFEGPNRHGLDQVDAGLGIALMNQARDDTKPTWKIGAEARIAIGRVARFDPTEPTANTAVGQGAHEVRLWTTFDRRLGWAEPWLELYWQVPLAYTSASLFQNPGSGATNTGKGQIAGANFGFEAYAITTPDQNRISLDIGARIIGHFEGREYTPLWEMLAYAGSPTNSGPLVWYPNPLSPGAMASQYPGISNVENYLETGARVAVRAQLGPHVRFAVLGDAVWVSDHAITFADAGVDRNGNMLIDPNSNEVNPLHVDAIDLVGHRYHSVHELDFIIGVQGQVLF